MITFLNNEASGKRSINSMEGREGRKYLADANDSVHLAFLDVGSSAAL